jgi:hypothetical protein
MRLRFYDALFDFGMDGIEPDFEGVDEIIWIPMRDFILQSKQTDEHWHDKQRKNAKLGGAPKGNQNARKHPKVRTLPSDEQTAPNNPNNPNNPKQPIREENRREETQIEEKRREESEESDSKQPVDSTFSLSEFGSADSAFSLSEELHPIRKDVITRILAHKKTWNELGISPPCNLITFPPLQIQDMMPTLQSYQDERIDKAIHNYAKILKEGNLDRKPCSSFVNFMIRWVERYVDEAKPFSRATIPKRDTRAVVHGEAFD